MQALLTDHFISRNNAARSATLYAKKLLPSVKQHLELTRTAYENGEADLRELTVSEERLADLKRMLARIRTDGAIAEAEIEKLIGGPP